VDRVIRRTAFCVAFVVIAIALLGGTAAAAAATLTVAWDPSPDPSVSGYRVHVRTAGQQSARVFDAGPATVFAFSAAQPAVTYSFAVAAYTLGGQTSALSGEITAMVPPDPRAGSLEPAAPVSDTTPQRTSETCAGGPAARCYAIRILASGVGRPTSMAAADDGRLFFVEEKQRIRVVAAGTVLPEPALTSGRGTEITGLMLPKDFLRSGQMFLAERQTTSRGTSMQIARYRNLQNVLGQAAVVIPPIATPRETTAPTAIDDAGNLYLSIPESLDRDPYGSRVLRFNAEGRVPAENRSSSPVLAFGYATPTAMAVDHEGTLWLAGRDQQQWSVSQLALSELSAQSWPAVPVPAAVAVPGQGMPTALAPGEPLAVGGTAEMFQVTAAAERPAELLRVTRRAGQRPETAALALPNYGEPISVAVSPTGDRIYVGVRTSPSVPDDFTLLELRAQTPGAQTATKATK
jgi:hypothetical protein